MGQGRREGRHRGRHPEVLRLVFPQSESGRFKPGSRLSTEIAMVSKSGIATDGPFSEAKEVIGGYWIIVASSLREAAEIAAQNPCIQHGLRFEIRPLEAERASAYNVTNENPAT